MFSELFKPLRRNFAIRLSLWYALLFAVAGAGLLAFAYWSLAVAVGNKDREVLDARLKELAVVYEAGGVNALERWTARQPDEVQRTGYIRLVNRFNQVLFLRAPKDWVSLEAERIRGQVGIMLRIPQSSKSDVLLGSIQVRDGSLLQIGLMADSRAAFLNPLRRKFLTAGLVTLLLCSLAGVLFAYRSTAPVRHTVATVQGILRTGQLDGRVPAGKSEDELDEMARLFNTLLERNQRLISALREALDNIAHDLRTPLARLRMSAETALLPGAQSEKAQDALVDCVEESERMLKMLNTLMDISEAEAGMMKLQREPVDLCRLASEIQDLYLYAAEEKAVTIRTDCPHPVMLTGDGTRLRQVLANLVDNAIKYNRPNGQVVISIRDEEHAAVIKVMDTGEGIPGVEQDRIWTRLYRGDKSRSQRGLGLGLSVVKAVVEAHGGSVHVVSTPGQGSTFTVKLPRPQNGFASRV